MLPVATDVERSVVCVSVCLLVAQVSCAKMTEPIEMSFGDWLMYVQLTVYKMGSRSPTSLPVGPRGRGTFEGDVLAHCNIPTYECIGPDMDECFCPACSGQMQSLPGGLTRQWGLLSNYFCYLHWHKLSILC